MNTQKYRWILYFITATTIITIAVQVYWNYKNYQLNKQRVTNEIQLSLDNALEEYYAGLAKTDFLTIIETGVASDSSAAVGTTEVNIRRNHDKSNKETVDSILVKVQNDLRDNLTNGQTTDSILGYTKFSESGDGYTFMKSNSVKKVKVLKGKKAQDSLALIKSLKPVLIAIKRDSLEYSTIDSLLQKELGNKNIALLYTINHIKNDSLFHNTNSTLKTNRFFTTNSKSTYLKPQEEIKLLYKNPFSEALKRSFTGILISLLLSAAIIACLFYLLQIIKHQKQLAEVKNDLISNITHEFKTPIATIGVALESIKDFKVLEDKEKTKNYLDMSGDQLTKLNIMVEKLLETATLDSDNLDLKKEGINIVGFLTNQIDEYQLQTKKTIKLETTSSNILAHLDPFHFNNAISNIIDNAIKYGGNTITLNVSQNQNTVFIDIVDNGNTLTKANKNKIFEKFYRVPKGNQHDVKGFGIGLYYTKKIIEKHGGSIYLDLNNNETRFKISIPNE